MKRILGTLSTVLFFVGLVFYIIMLFGNDNLLLSNVILSAIGFVLALFAEKGVYKKIGLIGNGLILLIAIIIPFIVTTFFWNTP
ncbi:hypothetical protein [Exiguobacterium oxidotolerans]|uniref:hypothetical protein n=1 Tax=Exiguobacterium oxidotolerans TaxID=223958 RepID=UPI000494BA49|nr:hypothetical protein [Exiguobacterium oxidotolerans]